MGVRVNACINNCELVGLPEARIILAETVIDMCLSPKSNSSEEAIDLALNDIRNGNTGNLPVHLRTNSPFYKYPHNYPNCFVKQQYMPDNLKNREYYKPKYTSTYEKQLAQVYEKLKELQK
jgi:putative ATPase